MTWKELIESGMVTVGHRVETNANGDGSDPDMFRGTIERLNEFDVEIKRDDNVGGGGTDHLWWVYAKNTQAVVTIVDESPKKYVTLAEAMRLGKLVLGPATIRNAGIKLDGTGTIVRITGTNVHFMRDDGTKGGGTEGATRLALSGKSEILINGTWSPPKCRQCNSGIVLSKVNGVPLCKECISKLSECNECGKLLLLREEFHTDDGKTLCSHCVGVLRYRSCADCGVISLTLTDSYCAKCISQKFKCSRCGGWHPNEIRQNDPSNADKPYCPACWSTLFFSCFACGDVFKRTERLATREGYICKACADERYKPCRGCGNLTLKDRVITHRKSGYTYCSGCNEKYRVKTQQRAGCDVDMDATIKILLADPPEALKVKMKLELNKYNPADPVLKELVEQVGEVRNPIYIYGLQDRDDCWMTLTKDLLSIIRTSTENGKFYVMSTRGRIPAQIIERSGGRTLGFSRVMRDEYFSLCADLIATASDPVTKNKEAR